MTVYATASKKACPVCAEAIHDAAGSCPYCGALLTAHEAPWMLTETPAAGTPSFWASSVFPLWLLLLLAAALVFAL